MIYFLKIFPHSTNGTASFSLRGEQSITSPCLLFCLLLSGVLFNQFSNLRFLVYLSSAVLLCMFLMLHFLTPINLTYLLLSKIPNNLWLSDVFYFSCYKESLPLQIFWRSFIFLLGIFSRSGGRYTDTDCHDKLKQKALL